MHRMTYPQPRIALPAKGIEPGDQYLRNADHGQHAQFFFFGGGGEDN